MIKNKLGNFVNIRTGKLDANASSSEGGYPFFTCSKKPLKISSYSYDCECVLVAGNGDLNVKYYDGKFDAYQRTYIIESRDKNILNTRYLYWFLSKYVEKLRELSIGGVIKYIKLNNLTDPLIPLPSLEDQKRIVKILDKADVLRQKRKQAISRLDDYLKSVFLEMFGDPVMNQKGWSIKPFEHFAKIDTNMTKDFDKYADFPHIGIENIEKNTGKLKNYKKIEDLSLKSGKYVFTPEHIIYSKIRPNLNKVALPDFNGLSSADSYPILVNKDNSNKYFFSFMLRSKAFLDYAKGFSRRANIPKINKKQLLGFNCIAPSLNLQNKFEKIYQETELVKQKMLIQSQELENQFQSLLRKVSKGEL